MNGCMSEAEGKDREGMGPAEGAEQWGLTAV